MISRCLLRKVAVLLAGLWAVSNASDETRSQPPAVVSIPKSSQLLPLPDVGQIPKEFVKTQAPVGQASKTSYASTNGVFSVGLYETRSASRAVLSYATPYAHDEMMVVLRGTIRVTGAHGETQSFTVGDALVLPKGWTGTIELSGEFRILHAEYAP